MMINIIVIVIAVIAILSAVLIPTFSNVVSNAKDAALKADLKAIYTEYVADAAEKGLEVEEEVVIEITDTEGAKYYKVSNGQLVSELEEPVCDAKVYGDNIYFADHLDGDDDNTACDRTGCPAD